MSVTPWFAGDNALCAPPEDPGVTAPAAVVSRLLSTSAISLPAPATDLSVMWMLLPPWNSLDDDAMAALGRATIDSALRDTM